METRDLGPLTVSAVGLGCMGMSQSYGPADASESRKTLRRALELGVTFWDTADFYGAGHNEELIAPVLREARASVVLATKFGLVRNDEGQLAGVCGTPEYVRRACDASLRRLGIETIDLYYQHRVDRDVPIEDTVGAMAELVTAGKVRYLGLSEVSAATLRRAHAVHPIAAVQSEYSLWTRDPEVEVLAACAELGVGFVAYSPLGRGFLTARVQTTDALAADDFRRTAPRFEPANLEHNLLVLKRIETMAAEKRCTPAQLAIAWVLSRGQHVVPIPGTKRVRYLEENTAALDVWLSRDDVSRISAMVPPGAFTGERYNSVAMAWTEM